MSSQSQYIISMFNLSVNLYVSGQRIMSILQLQSLVDTFLGSSLLGDFYTSTTIDINVLGLSLQLKSWSMYKVNVLNQVK